MNYEKIPKYTCNFCLNTKFNDKLYKIAPKEIIKTNKLGIIYCHKHCLTKFKEVFKLFLDTNKIELDLEKLISKKMILSNTIFCVNEEFEMAFSKGLENIEKMSKKYKIDNNLVKNYLEFLICISYWNFF